MVFQTVLLSFLLRRNRRGFYSDIYCVKLVDLLEINHTIVPPPLHPWLGSPGVFNSLKPSAICEFLFRFSNFVLVPTEFPAAVSALVSYSSLNYPVCLSSRGDWLPCFLPTVTDPKIVAFSICLPFTCQNRMVTFNLLICRTKNWPN